MHPSEPHPMPTTDAPPVAHAITHERGPMTRQVLAAAWAWNGQDGVSRLLAGVSPRCRARFEQPIGFFEWVESDLALELHAAWSALQGGDTMAQRGEDAAREMLGGPQGWLLRMASPDFLLANLPRLFRFYYRGGELSVAPLSPGHAQVLLQASGYPESWFREALPAWMRVALELTGVRTTAIQVLDVDPARPEQHPYDVRWT